MEEHRADSLQHVSGDIEDYSQLDVSSSDFADGGSSEFAFMPAYVQEQLKQEDLRRCSVPFYHSKQLSFLASRPAGEMLA